MTDDPPEPPTPATPPPKPARSPAQAEREQRLAAALRENLKRRKAQSRERGPRPPATEKD
ncbi:hypothetical protein D9599_03525 [Roseomonas sp. KE2513]|uniref:hypothetical protein n=1 Tax=Roseomonas sp. KE2513 TaxID=2479202 RepID=UPI0018DF4004|nr:hypothetical protein [Roseomonas sp. KE2513]MBI0534639.1 hypothetical protein [Roseomonas sp. KE2513]